MKRILSLLVLLSLTLTTAWAGKIKFTAHGTTKPNAKEIVVFDATDPQNPLATLPVTDGKFTYTNTLPDDTYLVFADKENKLNCPAITDGENILVDLIQEKASGTPLNDELFAIIDTLDALFNQSQAQNVKYLEKVVDRHLESTFTVVNPGVKYLEKVVERHRKDCIPVPLIASCYRQLPPETANRLCDSKMPYTRHPLFWRVAKMYEEDKPRYSLIGKKYTNVTLHNGRGEKVKLSEAIGQGKYVLVDFWASWCGPCMGEMPYLKECYAKYKEKGFEIVGISLDKNRAAWINAIAQKELTWPQYSDLDQFNNEAASTYQVSSIPWNFLCDPDGTIIAVSLRGEALAEKLAEVMK